MYHEREYIECSTCKTVRMYACGIYHFDIWQNQYNIEKFKNKIKFKKIKYIYAKKKNGDLETWNFKKIPKCMCVYKIYFHHRVKIFN